MIDKYVNAIKNFIPGLISLVVVFVVATLIYHLAGPALGLEPKLSLVEGVIHSVATVVASSLLTVLAVTAIDSGK